MATTNLCVIALGAGFLLMVVGSILLLVRAFQKSFWWGLATFFLPFGNIVFTCVHWEEAKIGFLPLVAGLALCAGGVCSVPFLNPELIKRYHLPAVLAHTPTAGVPDSAAELNAQILEHRQQLEALRAAFAQDGVALTRQYQALEAQRKALRPEDTAAITKFNETAAAYQGQNTARKQMLQQIEMAEGELDGLLDARVRAQATAAASNAKKVVMYTTSHCPACKAAKQYLAQKGVSYDEIDVERSPEGLAAFQKLGGHGVPLILVGDKRMEGFSPQALDAAL